MREMKDSGVDWIGSVPSSWGIIRGKTVFHIRTEKGNTEEVLLAATQKNGMYPQHLLEGVVQVAEGTDLQQFKTVHVDDYVISLRSFQGGFEMSDYEGVCSPAYQVFFNIKPIDKRYFKRLFKSQGFIDKMNSLTVGIREGKNIQYSDFANSFIPYPALSEQQRIADFLDRKCADIDNVLEKTKASIEEYRKLKQSVITEAVTKGVRGERPMKDSGIEWIGEIPDSSRIWRLKHLLAEPLLYGASESGIPYEENLPRYIRITDITMDGRLKDTGKLSLTKESAKGYLVNEGDILFARSGATVGKAFIFHKDYGECAFAGYLIKAAFDKNRVLPQFIFYYTQSSLYEEWKKQIFVQATIQNIGADRYSELPVVLSSLEEQQEIASYLDQKCSEIDSLIESKERFIKELEAYRKSLIYEYVTGKKEVFA